MTENSLTEEALAAQIGVSRVSVNRYRHGIIRPRRNIIMAIVKATGGLVTANDLLGIEQSAPAE